MVPNRAHNRVLATSEIQNFLQQIFRRLTSKKHLRFFMASIFRAYLRVWFIVRLQLVCWASQGEDKVSDPGPSMWKFWRGMWKVKGLLGMSLSNYSSHATYSYFIHYHRRSIILAIDTVLNKESIFVSTCKPYNIFRFA
jgi:hypothetical protein